MSDEDWVHLEELRKFERPSSDRAYHKMVRNLAASLLQFPIGPQLRGLCLRVTAGGDAGNAAKELHWKMSKLP